METDNGIGEELLKSSQFRIFVARLASATVKADTAALAAKINAKLEGSQELALRRKSRKKARTTAAAAVRSRKSRD